jgi:dTDP-4-amino-4,6-dideoxygalactose transaminase
VWEGCTPVFADIDPETLCLDPHAVESLISPETTALMPVHVYGNPCDVDELKAVADRHGLKIIYDAAHAFGVEYPLGTSVLTHGDISTLSFHATKLFHTCEGGAIVTENDELAHRISYLRNFGHNGPEAFWGLGVNGKCSEVHAAMGLCVLPKVDELIERRRALTDLYDLLLRDCAAVRRPRLADRMRYNYAYYPLVLASEEDLLLVRDELKVRDVLPRRYFYPSLSTLSYVPPSDVPIAEDISKRALCLPLFPDLDPAIVRDICATIVSTLDQRMAYAGNM